MKQLHIVTTVIEAGAGVALMVFPSATVMLLLGSPLDSPAGVTLGRVAGAALLALGIASWFASGETKSRAANGMITAMLLYNLGVAGILAVAGINLHTVGIALWPAVGLHAVMTVWCVACLLKSRHRKQSE